MSGIFYTIEDITSSLYDIKPPFLWHHTRYIWHCIHCICVITSTVLMISRQLYLWDLIFYVWWHHIHCIQYHIYYICKSHTLSLCHHNHSFDVITPFVCMTSHRYSYIIIYTIEGITHFMTSHHYIYYVITILLFMSSHALHSWHHSHYIWHCIHCICVITDTLLMISDLLYIWHHTHFMYDILCTLHYVPSTL